MLWNEEEGAGDATVLPRRPIRLELRQTAAQFALLVAVKALIGACSAASARSRRYWPSAGSV